MDSPGRSTKATPANTLAAAIAGLMEKRLLDERVAAIGLIVRLVADGQRRIFVEGPRAELAILNAMHTDDDPWIAAA